MRQRIFGPVQGSVICTQIKRGKNGTNSNNTIIKWTDWVAQADTLLLRQLSVNVNDRAMLHHLYIYNQPCV